MTADPGLVLAWLVLAHLVADFVLQPGRMARSKAAPGSGATSALLAHALVVGVCVVPFGLAFGVPGWWVVAIVTFSHAVIDRLKSVLTRRAEAAALAEARRRHEAAGTAPGRSRSGVDARARGAVRRGSGRPRRDPRRRLGGPALGGATRPGLCRLGGRLARGQGSRGRPRSALPRRRPREPADRQHPRRGAVRGRACRASTGD